MGARTASRQDHSPRRQRAGRRADGWALAYVRLPAAYAMESGGQLHCAIPMQSGGECGRSIIGFLGVCEQHRKRIRASWALERLGEAFRRGSRTQPPLIVADAVAIDNEIAAYLDAHSLRARTRSSYEGDLRSATRLLAKPVLECTPTDVLRLIDLVVEAGFSGSTLDRMLAAISWAHRCAGQELPTKNVAVIEAAKTGRRDARGRAVPRQPITPAIAGALIGQPPEPSPSALRRAVTGIVALAAPAASPERLARIHPGRDVTLSATRASIRVGELRVTIQADSAAPGGRCPVALVRAWLDQLPGNASCFLGQQFHGGMPTDRGYACIVRADLAMLRQRLGGSLGTDPWRVIAAADLDFVRWIYRRAVIAVGFALGSRISDWRGVRGTSIGRRGAARLFTLGITKTDSDGGTTLGLVPAQREHDLCPVAALDAWMRLAEPGSAYLFGVLTPGGWRNDQLLEPRAVTRLLKEAGAEALARDPDCGVEPSRLSSRSLRCGFVVTALDDTADLCLIATTTLHKNVEYLGTYAAAGHGDRPAHKLFAKGPRS